MSGIVGIVQRDGAPVPLDYLQNMASALTYRGAEREEVWIGGPAGLGYCGLRTGGAEDLTESLPVHLGTLVIVADVRLDLRRELKQRLELAGQNIQGDAQASDSTLILQAYCAWGTRCVEHLRGDFSFAIWDQKKGQLFCARDHLGVKPFYYAVAGPLFCFGSTIGCIQQHPAVTRTLNETAVGDFLLFGLNYNKGTTIFRDVQRLAPGHSMTVSRDGLQIESFWTLPSTDRIHYNRDEEYVEHFDEILKSALADRLHADAVGVLLSGGLDSGALATLSKEISDHNGGRPEIRSYTIGYAPQENDEEGRGARALAEHLGIANRYCSLEDVQLFADPDDSDRRFPEPVDSPLAAGLFKQFEDISSECRVAISGEGADNLMDFQMWPHVQEMGRNGSWFRLAGELTRFLWIRPFPWRGIAHRVRARLDGKSAGLPPWIEPEFAQRANLAHRLRRGDDVRVSRQHRARPRAYASMLMPHWTTMFELQDPGVTRCPVGVRYPYLDLRMVNFLLAVPAFPWMYRKHLLRRAMMGKLPDSHRLRKKTPLRVHPTSTKFRSGESQMIQWPKLEGQICEFVRASGIRQICDRIGADQFRPYCLAAWLKCNNLG